jgi:two-component system, OmpR family, alkaline phosphatase synthesis response regulator PhoP
LWGACIIQQAVSDDVAVGAARRRPRGTRAMSKEDDVSLPPSKILIADDNLQNLELIEAYMEDLPNVTVLTATDGRQTLDKIRAEHPDLVVLDVMMPAMSGFEICKKIKADPDTKDIPVVMVTALNEPMDIERGLESGTDDYLTKPIVRQDLIDRIKSLLQVRHLRGQLDRSLAYMDELESELDADDEPSED